MNPRAPDSLRTARLRLRRLAAGDAAGLSPTASDPRVMEHWHPGPDPDIAAVERRIAHMDTHWQRHGFGDWGIVESEAERLIASRVFITSTACVKSTLGTLCSDPSGAGVMDARLAWLSSTSASPSCACPRSSPSSPRRTHPLSGWPKNWASPSGRKPAGPGSHGWCIGRGHKKVSSPTAQPPGMPRSLRPAEASMRRPHWPRVAGH